MKTKEIEGKIKLIGEVTQYGANFRKVEFVVTTIEKYPQDIKLEFYQDDCHELENYSVGDDVVVFYNLKGNEYKGKYYVNLQAWKIEIAGMDQLSPEERQEMEASAISKRGQPAKNPPAQSTEDLTKDVEELADAPF